MKTVSLQGIQLSPGQRRMLEQQRHVREFMNPVLTQQVAETLAEIEVRKEQGTKPEKIWFHDRESSWQGTISVAEWMGY
ncbi:hypothetical protein [Pseudomonas syringae]|uniref:Uncharacterized protein n=1 Tax=Pseudomonas syringae pv. aptata TaxID=83167 RepID=A0A0Q0BYZ4_PSEAP|nr:hypothetical protein [Pseudomonas syringae]KPZ01605.1 hypothetical protein ALO85_100586 [Pseudomonas syringae pv. aptata]MDP5166046.1 hypothetical protein [Pseudomonas syringae pv. aptata str. DSM 50252]MDP5166055.1 hypothetical protein [Pseudomonas syringae pv. aptata str. DSM 50252]MDP5166064.1 hypothetical protein [Pseudomonas syringae pv. aptata str. DSM 50252]RMO58537.1 hypothetical protein ALQ37_200122 [Pseudomonas syringae pv. aptata]